MSLSYMILGFIIMMMCFFLAQTASLFFADVGQQQIDLLKMLLLTIGIVAPFIGALE